MERALAATSLITTDGSAVAKNWTLSTVLTYWLTKLSMPGSSGLNISKLSAKHGEPGAILSGRAPYP